MTPENYFLRYAFPCAFILKDMGEIDDKKLKQLENIAVHNKKIQKKELEKLFCRAFEKLKRFAKEKKAKNCWTVDFIKEYYQKQHNKDIDKKDGYYATCGSMMRELSKVYKAKIIGKKNKVLIVKYNKNKRRNVLNTLVPEAKINDSVYIHFGFAVEKAE